MKNHFIFSYAGNKRNEVANNLEYLLNEEKKADFNKVSIINIKTIIEPFTGSGAFSYYMSIKYPNKFNYVLNDNNKHLKSIFNEIRDKSIEYINLKMNELIHEFNSYKDDKTRKDYYLTLVKGKDSDIYKWLFVNKYYSIRTELYPPLSRVKQIKPFNIEDFPIYKFYKNENIIFENKEGKTIYEEFKDNGENLIYLDPPYLMSCNDFYENGEVSIYEYLVDNNINKEKARILLCLENNWIIKLLFKTNKKSAEYSKIYQNTKKKVNHIMYSN